MNAISLYNKNVKNEQYYILYASMQYMHGEITVEELAAVEKQHNLNLRKDIMAVASQRMRYIYVGRLVNGMKKQISKYMVWFKFR